MVAKLLVTGATGFTGYFVCRELTQRGVSFDCLVRARSNTQKLVKDFGVNCVLGDLNDIDSLRNIFPNYSTLINIASIGFGAAPIIVKAGEESGLERAIFVSTTAIFTQLNAQSKQVRLAAEEAIKTSRLNYTILRPTMIYGTPQDRNMIRLLKLVEASPIVPVFGDGKSLQQPVHVEDVAWAIAAAALSPHADRKEYNLSGGEVLNYNQVIHLAGKALGKRPILLHFPQSFSINFLTIAERLSIKMPVKSEQVARLNEDKVFDHSLAAHDFGYAPRTFAQGIAQEALLLKRSNARQ